MHGRSRLSAVPLAAVLFLGCSASGTGSPSLLVGSEGSSGGATGGGTAGSGGQGPISLGGESSRGFSAHIEENGVTVEIITLACVRECADVEAVATGGRQPYVFSWEDGSANPQRHVCPTSTTAYEAKVTDQGVASGEFPRPPATASAKVTAEVLRCPAAEKEGGALPANKDGGIPPATGGFCIENPSLEGTPGLPELGTYQLPDWTICAVTPDVNPLFAKLAPTDGTTYLGVIGTNPAIAESAGTSFCSPLKPEQPISFSVDVAVSSYASAPAELELWGGSTSCSKDELLWKSPVISDVDSWHTFCATVTPSKAFPYLVLWPTPTTLAGAYVLIDNFKPQPSCH
jgi:hypothetical protein